MKRDLTKLLKQLHPTNWKVKGDQFESLAKWFLEHDARFDHLTQVWHRDDWPGNLGPDTGIDLVAEDNEGNLWAIQAKAYKDQHWIKKSEIDSFLSDSNSEEFSHRLLIATTDRIGVNAQRTIDKQEKPVTFFGISKLETSQVNWPASLSDLQAPKPEPKRPEGEWAYQGDAVNAIVAGFEQSDRGQLLMACGTGKTLVALFAKEKLGADRTLVLAPSLSLLSQTITEWTANATTAFEYRAVCSDETVGDSTVMSARELGDRVIIEPEKIAAFLRGPGSRVVFSTYQSSPQIAEAFKIGRVRPFDLVVADEAHRTVGRKPTVFTTVLDDEEIKAKRRLFMTATPRYVPGSVIGDVEALGHDVASMDNEAKHGPVFHRLKFSEAIDLKLLTDYQVVVVGVDDVEYRKMAEKATWVRSDGIMDSNGYMLAAQIGLAKTMRKYDMRRAISFHSRVNGARLFSRSFPEVVSWMPARQRPTGQVWADHVSGEMTARKRTLRLRELGAADTDHRRLLSNARCLTEGVDVPTLDGVIFVDPKRSETDIVQAVGRAIRLAPDKTVGTIVIPVFMASDEDHEVILDDSTFKTLWEVIKALRLHDEELAEYLDSLRLGMGRPGGQPRLPEKIHLDLPTHIGADFARAFSVRLVSSVTAPFLEMVGLVEQFVEEHKHALVPKDYETVDGVKLGIFVTNQRVLKSNNKLSPERIDRLDKIPEWEWDVREVWWKENYLLCRDYRAEKGKLPVFKTVFRGVKIGKWCNKQRTAKKQGKLSDERIDLLEAIDDWEWDGNDAAWGKGLRHAQEARAREGHTRVPQSYKSPDDGYATGSWIFKQRNDKKQGKLSDERIKLLEETVDDWEWDVSIMARWMEKYTLYRDWSVEHGHKLPRVLKLDGHNIGHWVNNQRAAKRRGKLSDEQIKLLDVLDGWDWEPKKKGYYTLGEDKIILQGASLREVCRLLPNRTEQALKVRRSTLRTQHGLSSTPRPYSPEEDEIILQGGVSGVSGEELGRRLGRTPASIRNRRYYLNGGKK